MLNTFTDMAPERLLAGDHVPGRGIVSWTATEVGYAAVFFTNGNEAHYRRTQRITIHRPA